MKNLFWITLFIVIGRAVQFNVELVFVDFIHGNPHRPQSNALAMMAVDTPLFAIIDSIRFLLVLTLPQIFQAAVIAVVQPLSGDRSRLAAFAALPITTLITFYCYDYTTPSNVCFGGCAVESFYEHGLSLPRYLTTLVIQTPITLFGFLYLKAGLGGRSKAPLILAALAIAVVLGGIEGYLQARVQYQFL